MPLRHYSAAVMFATLASSGGHQESKVPESLGSIYKQSDIRFRPPPGIAHAMILVYLYISPLPHA